MTVMKLLVDVGEASLRFHDGMVTGLSPSHIECDEAWSYCYAKGVPVNGMPEYAGDIWAWVGIDPATKLVVSWLVSPGRGLADAISFMRDLRSRTTGRVTISTDGLGMYKTSIKQEFGGRCRPPDTGRQISWDVLYVPCGASPRHDEDLCASVLPDELRIQ